MENIRTAMNRGAFDFITKPINFEDLSLTIDKTIKHVTHIKNAISALKENNILKMYVDENVLNFMNTSDFESKLMSNETIDATVAFIDICGYTSMSEKHPANIIVSLLNDYFDIIVKEVIAENGHVDKFMGDAVMAVFRGPFHLDRAVEACLNVSRKLKEIPADSNPLLFKPNISIGINSGEMVSGNMGSVSLRRLDYTVIGDIVNTAQRLQAAAKEGQIIINETCYEKIKESFNCVKIGEVTLKNKAHSTTIFQVKE
jgi:class 3 adenylate cyclase